MGCCESKLESPVEVVDAPIVAQKDPELDNYKQSDFSTSVPSSAAFNSAPSVEEVPQKQNYEPPSPPSPEEEPEPAPPEIDEAEEARKRAMAGIAEGEGGFLVFSRADQGRLDICWSRKGVDVSQG